jgi:hypothetical protein
MGFDVETFNMIFIAGFTEKYFSTPIPRDNVNSTGDPKPGRCSLDAAGALGLVLHYLNSTMQGGQPAADFCTHTIISFTLHFFHTQYPL